MANPTGGKRNYRGSLEDEGDIESCPRLCGGEASHGFEMVCISDLQAHYVVSPPSTQRSPSRYMAGQDSVRKSAMFGPS